MKAGEVCSPAISLLRAGMRGALGGGDDVPGFRTRPRTHATPKCLASERVLGS